MTTEIVQVRYPAQYETEVLLKDGSRIALRPIKREDTERWLAFLRRLSQRSKYLRFHYVPREFTMEDAIRYCSVDYNNTFAFVAEHIKGNEKEIMAIGRYYRLPDKHSAEVAFAIEDPYQGKGIGTKLMEWLSNVARDHDIDRFEADVLAENEEMMNVFKDYGFHITSTLSADEYHVSFPIARTPHVIQKEEERERVATLASLQSLLCPGTIAVVGASRRTGSIGNLVFKCILENEYTGTVYPINPNAPAVLGVKTYKSVLDVPDNVDLAVIVVPAENVNHIVDECGRKGVRSIVVISDGFKERGKEGAERERELREITLGYGMRLLGPNCMGVLNTARETNLNATFSKVYPPVGNVAFLSQSGAMGLVILDYANNLNLGISSFVSVGNRADISPNDLLQYWEQDKATKVILLYIESFGDARKFSRISRRVASKKPIIAVKGGTTTMGSRAASSHTGAMATSVAVSDALFYQAGIIRVNTIEDLFGVASLLANQPLPKGRRLAIVTNGGGPGIIAADASDRYGLVLPEYSAKTRELLQPVVRPNIALNNPMDMTAGASGKEFEDVLNILAKDDNYDAVLTIFIPPIVIEPSEMADAIRHVASLYQKQEKPLLVCFMGQSGLGGKLGSEGQYVPSFSFPEEAVSALSHACTFVEQKNKPKGSVPKLTGIKRDAAQKVIEKALTRSMKRPLWLTSDEVAGLFDSYGIKMAETATAATAEEAAKAATEMGFPVVVKLASNTITHKSDVGGVILDVKSAAEVKKAFADIKSRLTKIGKEKEMQGVVVQKMINEGVETIVGVSQDPQFGPVMMFGLGGIYTELFKDVAFRLHPLTDIDAKELIGSIKMAKIFQGFRGAPPSDTGAVEDLLLRLSAMIEDFPDVVELDLNPVKVLAQGEGYRAVDARILVK